uniref:Uncharacterized protein n=1 Tax=Arion vulgaris TaxID=1028688 RepID=A0A0B7AFR6_9EUPU
MGSVAKPSVYDLKKCFSSWCPGLKLYRENRKQYHVDHGAACIPKTSSDAIFNSYSGTLKNVSWP